MNKIKKILLGLFIAINNFNSDYKYCEEYIKMSSLKKFIGDFINNEASYSKNKCQTSFENDRNYNNYKIINNYKVINFIVDFINKAKPEEIENIFRQIIISANENFIEFHIKNLSILKEDLNFFLNELLKKCNYNEIDTGYIIQEIFLEEQNDKKIENNLFKEKIKSFKETFKLFFNELEKKNNKFETGYCDFSITKNNDELIFTIKYKE